MPAESLVEALSQAVGHAYRVEGKIGSGGMATVFCAEDARHQRRVAIKVLSPQSAVISGTDRFLREIRMVAALQHPHILPLLDSGSFDWKGESLPYFVMPLVAGQSLRAKLDRDGRSSIEEVFRIARDVADGLD